MFHANVIVAAIVLGVGCVGIVSAKPAPLKATITLKGSVDDDKLLAHMPENGVITNAKAFTQLHKSWGVAGKVPEVNFEKELVLVTTSSGSRLNLSAALTETGDLRTLGFGTQDFLPGFRYVIISVSKVGILTVNGKKLPK